MNLEKLAVLQQPHMLSMIITIYENPGISKSELYDLIDGSSGTKTKRLTQLIDEELVSERKSKSHASKRELYLTDKGQRLGLFLTKLLSVLDEEYEGPEDNLNGS